MGDKNEPTGFTHKPNEAGEATGPPIFGPFNGRWTINSDVRVYWWAAPNAERAHPEEHSGEGQVVGLHKDKTEQWVVEIDFGPVWSLIHPTMFRPNQVQAL